MALTDNTEKINQLLEAINALPDAGDTGGSTDPVLRDVTITANGTYTPGVGYDGFDEVTVNVPIPSGYIKPSGTFTATENGTFDIAEYASVLVNVATGGSGGGLPIGHITHLTSGTYVPAEKKTSGVMVDHDLGMKPNFFVWMVENDTSNSVLTEVCTFGALLDKPSKYTATSTINQNILWVHGGYNTSSQYNSSHGRVQNTYLTATQCRLHVTSTYPAQPGYKYHWVCGVLA